MAILFIELCKVIKILITEIKSIKNTELKLYTLQQYLYVKLNKVDLHKDLHRIETVLIRRMDLI